MADELQRWAGLNPNKVAWRLSDGSDPLTYEELDLLSRKTAHLLIEAGIKQGDVIALCLPNCSEFFAITWAARRLGVYYTPMSVHLRSDEARYILTDCGAKVFFSTSEWTGSFEGKNIVVEPSTSNSGFRHRLARIEESELPDCPIGKDFVYSSGTTGRPKGIKRCIFHDKEQERRQGAWIQAFSKHDTSSICLTPAPLYHAAPLRFAMRSIQEGGTVIGMRKFDASSALKAIERWKVTHSLWVPTMFYRMLRLPEQERSRCDLSSLRFAVHSAGPCAPDLKRQMIDWWGPIIWEYYAASEGNGATSISSQEALQRPGSVGRAALGRIHIVGKDGNELPAGEIGEVYFEGGSPFEYHNDPERTASVRNAHGWSTVGDIGHLDADGYLYLSDRKSHTIISGGVNIYPVEVEQLLCRHPDVADSAVFGIPNAEYGEEVCAVIETNPGVTPDDDLAARLMHYCREHLSPLKCPKSIAFEAKLPRGDNGKLSKVALRARYASQRAGPDRATHR